MGVYIKGLKMPKGDNWITVRIYPDGTCGRPDAHGDCTLYNGAKAISVPPHGRLIDADKLCLSSGFRTDTEYGMGRSDQIEAIKSNAPTIIPAEEGE